MTNYADKLNRRKVLELLKERAEEAAGTPINPCAEIILSNDLNAIETYLSEFDNENDLEDDSLDEEYPEEPIKPCPFCGSTDLVGPHHEAYTGDYPNPHWWIECENCPASMTVYSEHKAELITRWNARAK